MPDPLLTLEHLSAGYTDAAGNTVPILRDVTLMVRAGNRVGVLGANGAGKSTLIKTLAEELPVQAGERRASRGLAIGYFHQHQLDMLDVDSTPLAHLARLAPEAREPGLRILRRHGQRQGRPHVRRRKARLALSLIVWQKPNLLLLDEQPPGRGNPRSPGRRAGGVWRQHAAGLTTGICCTTMDSFWIVADGAVREFDGDLEDY